MTSLAELDRTSPDGEPTRTCVGCRAKSAQSRLLRFRLDGARVVPALRGRPPARDGRSAYLCPKRSCLERAISRRAFTRAFSSRASVRPVETLDREAADALWTGSADLLRREIDLLGRSAHDPHAEPRRRSIEELLIELSSQPPPSARRPGKGGSPNHG